MVDGLMKNLCDSRVSSKSSKFRSGTVVGVCIARDSLVIWMVVSGWLVVINSYVSRGYYVSQGILINSREYQRYNSPCN